MKISACWITKNEERNILRSIESVRGAADELVVVDTGSADNTADAAKAAGARVEYFDWIGDFSAARNYAMSLASGDLIFFLDADEWFKTPLGPKDRAEIEEIFTKRPDAEALQIPIRNLNDQGALKTVSSGIRIMRNNPALRYQKRVHELLARENEGTPVIVSVDRWALEHTGYTEAILGDKMRRNIDLLEDAARNSGDPLERHLQHCYLVREYYHMERFEDSAHHLRLVLAEPEMIRRQYELYRHGFAPLVYSMLLVAAEARESVSRRELYRKLVEPFGKYLADYPGAPTIGLFYDVTFDLRDDELLFRIGPAFEAAEKARPSMITYYREAEMIINQRAAEASLRRGRLTDTMDYAVKSFRHTQNKNASALHVLLSCMRGLPAAEIIAFLNSQFDLGNPQKLEYLSKGTRMYGFRDVHAYYLDKRIRAGLATKRDYLYLLLLYGKYEEAAKAALEFRSAGGVAEEGLFLAAVCSRDERVYRDNAELLGAYANVLDAYFSGAPLVAFTRSDLDILIRHYGMIALAAGIGRANELRRLFPGQPLLGFQLMVKYCAENGLYEEALGEFMPDPDDYLSNLYVIESLVMTGRCDGACEKIERIFARGTVKERLLNYLLAIEARAPEGAGRRARALYDRYIGVYDRFIDLTDVVNTEYFAEDHDKKKARAFKSLTSAQFRKQLAEDASKPYISGLADICERAGDIYAERSAHASAAECYRFATAQGHNADRNREKLAGMFAAMGNYQLAGELRKK